MLKKLYSRVRIRTRRRGAGGAGSRGLSPIIKIMSLIPGIESHAFQNKSKTPSARARKLAAVKSSTNRT